MHAFDYKVRKKKVSGIYNIILLAQKPETVFELKFCPFIL